jgi:hypothetical protein
MAWIHLGMLWAFAFVQPMFDVLSGSPGELIVSGWAISDEDVPVDTVLLFEDDRFLADLTPTIARPGVIEAFGPQASKSGYEIMTPSAGLIGGGLRVFAVTGKRAAELPRLRR